MAVPDEDAVRRLAFVKYLLRLGKRQAHQPEPMVAAAVLTLHDAVEMFVHLAAEHVDADVGKKAEFLTYWDTIRTLTHRESMKRLNHLRVSLKHHGVLPAKEVVLPLVTTAGDFLTENTKAVFGRDLAAITLADLVELPIVRKHLTLALEQQAAGEAARALEWIAAAFHELVADQAEGLDSVGRTLVQVPYGLAGGNGDLHRFLDDVKSAVDSLQKRMHLLVLGIDLRAYQRFRSWTPAVNRYADGKGTLHVSWLRAPDTSPEVFGACFDFVIDAALELQQGGHPPVSHVASPAGDHAAGARFLAPDGTSREA